MFFIHLARKKCFLIQQFFTSPTCRNKFFGVSSSSTECIFSAEDKNEYVRYKFPKIDDLINVKQQQFNSSFTIIPDVVTVDEESQLISEIEKSLKRLRYQLDHWDNAIHDYRETEITTWKDPCNTNIIQRLKNKIFSDGLITAPMQRVHILDLSKKGYVKPHIDSVRFCGNIIAGLSLLSDSVMRLADEIHPDIYTVYSFLPRRSLYIMKDDVRYKYTHEILSDIPIIFSDKNSIRQRRVSIVMRNEPHLDFVK